MTSAIHDFRSINRKLNRQEQKAEFEAKEEAQRKSYAGLYGWPYGAAAPFKPLDPVAAAAVWAGLFGPGIDL